MQEIFEKIKERLETEVEYQSSKADQAGKTCAFEEITVVKAREKMAECYEHAIEIVNQVAEEIKMGDVSDGYHTFNELYHHRAVLFAVICHTHKDMAWKSRLHDTGDMYEGMFIVGVETPEGQATYHYDIEPYWDMFNVKELTKAPKWDGHTPDEAIRRIATLPAPYKPKGENNA